MSHMSSKLNSMKLSVLLALLIVLAQFCDGTLTCPKSRFGGHLSQVCLCVFCKIYVIRGGVVVHREPLTAPYLAQATKTNKRI